MLAFISVSPEEDMQAYYGFINEWAGAVPFHSSLSKLKYGIFQWKFCKFLLPSPKRYTSSYSLFEVWVKVLMGRALINCNESMTLYNCIWSIEL